MTHLLPVPLLLLRWVARLGSVVSIGLLIAFSFSGGRPPTGWEWTALAMFPGGVIVGMIVAWRHELLGGALVLLSLGAFYMLMLLLRGHASLGPWFVVFASPGLLFFLCGLLQRFIPRR